MIIMKMLSLCGEDSKYKNEPYMNDLKITHIRLIFIFYLSKSYKQLKL